MKFCTKLFKIPFLILLLIFVLILPSCAKSNANNANTTQIIPAVPGHSNTLSYTFVIDENAGDEIKSAAEQFCKKTLEITSGEMNITLTASKMPYWDFLLEKADFVLMDNNTAINASPIFKALDYPFLFSSYSQYTSAVNSRDFLSFVNAGFKETNKNFSLLAGFYANSNRLISFFELRDSFDLINYAKLYDTAPSVSFYNNTNVMAGFVSLGFNVQTEPDFKNRCLMMNSGDISVTEVSSADLSELKAIDSDYFYAKEFHSVEPVWMFTSVDLDSVNSGMRAAISEGVSYMFADIDEKIVAAENVYLQDLDSDKVEVYSLPNLFIRICRSEWSAHNPLNNMQKHLIDIIENISY